jgi:hypothetical protein
MTPDTDVRVSTTIQLQHIHLSGGLQVQPAHFSGGLQVQPAPQEALCPPIAMPRRRFRFFPAT